MMALEDLFQSFRKVADHPADQLKKFKSEGKKVIGCMPYYVPEELVYASGMVPMGMWGTHNKTISMAREYCTSFYCSLAQLDLEMLLDGTLDDLDGVLLTVLCDTLRPMSQNIRVAMEKEHKMSTIFMAHAQNRTKEYGKEFMMDQYRQILDALEKICGHEITQEQISEAIRVYNESRKARRLFVKLAGQHPEAVSARNRSAVLKSAYFMPKDEHTTLLNQVNEALQALPPSNFQGVKVVTSGIICDAPELLEIFDRNQIAIAADDVAHESRAIRVDVPEADDPIRALAEQWALQDYDVLLYDEASSQNRRGEYVAQLAKESGAQGVVVLMMVFCDPEEMEYPSLKKALDEADVPHIKVGIEMQTQQFGQIETALQALADQVSL